MTAAWEQISPTTELPSLPDVYVRLRDVLDDPESSMVDVADVVGADPGIAARLLRIVNSAYYSLATEIDTIGRAVNLLGGQEIHDLVLAISVAQRFAGMSNDVMDMSRFWKRSIVCAATARELATLCRVADGGRLFVNGLLSDIGHLFIYRHAPALAVHAMERAVAEQVPLYKAERAVIGTDYGRVGAELMRRWSLPQSLCEPTEYHVEPAKSETHAFATGIVHIAARMADASDGGVDPGDALQDVEPRAWQVTGLDSGACEGIIDAVAEQVTGVTRMILPGRHAS